MKTELITVQHFVISNLISIKELETSNGAKQISNFQRAENTHWSSHLSSIYNLINLFSAISIEQIIPNMVMLISTYTVYYCVLSIYFYTAYEKR